MTTQQEAIRSFIRECDAHGDNKEDTRTAARAFARRNGIAAPDSLFT